MQNGLTSAPNIMVGTKQEVVTAPEFYKTVGASFAYKYAPIINYREEVSRFGSDQLPEDGYIARKNIPEDLKPYGTSLLRATNQEHMDYLAANLRTSLDRRNTSAESGFFRSFAAEALDPVSYISIPLRLAGGIGKTALAAGTSTAAVVAGQEIARVPFDPLATTQETAINIGAAFVLGSALGGLTSIPAARRAEKIQQGEAEIKNLQKALEGVEGAEIDPNIASSLFTDSWLYKSVTTPMKRTLQNPKVPNSVKLTLLEIANDSGILLKANQNGQALKNSVFQNSKLRDGEWVQVYDNLVTTWGDSHGEGVTSSLDYMFKRSDFENWLTDIDAKVMRGEKAADDFEAKAMDGLNSFYSKWEKRLNEQGLLGNKGFYLRDIEVRESRIQNIEATLERYRGTNEFNRLNAIVTKNKNIIESHKAVLDDLDARGPTLPANEEVFRPRYWDKDEIKKNRAAFEAILVKWFTENPTAYTKGQKIELSTKPDAVQKRAVDAVDSILGLKDVTDFDVASFGHGKSKHFKHRGIDIPNKLVLDFIHRNPVSIMKAYTTRTAPRYEFSKQFNGKDFEDILDEKTIEMINSGMSIDEANAALKDMRHMYDRVVGTVLREPDTLSQKAAEVLRTAAQLSYLGVVGVSTITEPAKIIMEHGIGKTMKGLFGVLQDSQLKMGAKEARIAGEALEILMGSSHMRLVDDMGNNPLRSNFMDKTKNAFYTLNGLAPITRIFKDFDGMMRSHTIIDYSVRLTQGKATKMEAEYLARYNIDAVKAQKIANAPHQKSKSGMYIANTEAWTNTIEFPATKAEIISGPTDSYAAGGRYKPAFYRESENKVYIDEDYVRDVMWQDRGWENPRLEGVKPIEKGIINTPDDLVTFVKMHEIMHTIHSSKSLGFDKRTSKGKADYENAINDLATAEIKSQARVEPETVQSFRNALSSGIANTILMGTPADKPIITDGIAYVPMRVAKQFGMKEDSKYKGYARIENGLLGLPFQFYSYALAAVNKTTAAYGHGQLKNQFLGTAIAMGLGYTVLQIKTPDFVEMEFQDQFARAFDYSGVASLYSDLFYTAMSTSLALGGPNLTGGALQPRYPQEPNTADAVTGLLGAGPSVGMEYAQGLTNLVSGNVGTGSKEVIRALPFSNLWMIKDAVNKYTNMLEKDLGNGPSGFGRY
tara:strand:+ start:155 stop:3649 length:3495 start_codon:yes stop_codon:yes gene_type:complete